MNNMYKLDYNIQLHILRHGHGPGWSGSGSIWNLSRTVPVQVPVPGGSKRFLGDS